MRIFGIIIVSFFMAQAAMAYSTLGRPTPNMGVGAGASYMGNGLGAANTGEGVGTNFLSCGCAVQIIQKKTVKGDVCDTYSRLHVNAVTGQGSVTPAVAPANPLLSHQQ